MKLLLSLTFTVGLFCFGPAQKAHEGALSDCKYGQCKAIAKSTNEQCKHCVSNEGDTYCWQHD